MDKEEAQKIVIALKDYNLKFKLTSIASPEQYDVFLDGKQVAYVRLRCGNLTVEYPDVNGKEIYYHKFKDNSLKGSFKDKEERKRFIEIISERIKLWIEAQNEKG